MKERWRSQHCTANVIQTTDDYIDDHNWQHSPTGWIWTSHVTAWAVWVSVCSLSQVFWVSYQSSARSILHTLGTRTQSTILTQAAGCLAILFSEMQKRASCFNPSNLGLAVCVLVNVWLLSERPECITRVKHAPSRSRTAKSGWKRAVINALSL